MSDEEAADIDDLKEQFGGSSAGGDRLNAARQATAIGCEEFKGSILEAQEAIEDGDQQKAVSLWDGNVAALFAGLEVNDAARRNVAQALADGLAERENVPAGVDADEPDKSDVLRLALLHALKDATV